MAEIFKMRANAGNFSSGPKKMRPHAAACGQIGKSENAGAAACGFLDKNVPAFFIPDSDYHLKLNKFH